MSLTGLPQLGALAPRPAIGATEAELPNGDAGDAGLELALLGLGAAAPPPARATPPRSPEAFALDPNAAGLGFSPRPAISAEASAQPQPAAAPRAEGAMWWVAAMVQPAGAPPTVVPAAGGRAAAGLPPRPPGAPPAPAQLPPRAPSPGPLAIAAGPALTARPVPAPARLPPAA